MDIPVLSYVHRIFPKMERYFKFDNSDKNIQNYQLSLDYDETPYGVYENNSNQIKGSIVVTDRCLHYMTEENASKKCYYKEIEKCDILEDKLTVTSLDIHLKNNEIFHLPISRNYKNSKFSDLFEFWRFLNKVRH